MPRYSTVMSGLASSNLSMSSAHFALSSGVEFVSQNWTVPVASPQAATSSTAGPASALSPPPGAPQAVSAARAATAPTATKRVRDVNRIVAFFRRSLVIEGS